MEFYWSVRKIFELPATSVSFFRLGIPAAVLLIYFMYKKKNVFKGNHKTAYIASLLNGTRVFFYMIGFIYTSIGNAIIVWYTFPIFTAILSVFMFKEKISHKKKVLIAIAFLGIISMYLNKPFSFSNQDVLGMTSMLVAAMFHAGTIVLLKKEADRYSKYEMTFFQNILGGIIFLPFLFINVPFPTANQFSLGVVYALVCGVISYIFYFSALKRIKASTATFLSYTEVISAIIFGIIFFSEVLAWNMMLGGFLIIVATF